MFEYFPITLQTITIALMMSTRGKGALLEVEVSEVMRVYDLRDVTQRSVTRDER